MELLMIHLLLGVCFFHWTIATPYNFGNYVLDIDKQTVKSIRTTGYNPFPHLDLSNMRLKYFEETAFDDLTNITMLDLSNNKIKQLPPKIFSKLQRLESLSLANNKLLNITGLFVGLDKLNRLDLSNNSLSKLKNGDFYGLPDFTDIMIEGNKLESISSVVFQPQSVHKVADESTYQTYYELLTHDEMFSPSLSSDFRVRVCKNDKGAVKSVEYQNKNDKLGDCREANLRPDERILMLANHNLQNFEHGWYKLPANTMTEVDMTLNEIREITPALLNDLPAGLTAVDLSFNALHIIKKNVIKNPYIRELILNYNSIKLIDTGAFSNTDLAILHVAGNDLQNLDFLQALNKLEYLHLSMNSIKQISQNTFRGLTKLRLIDLSHNYVDSIEPEAFEDQTNLLELRLDNNQISELDPRLFKGMEKLKIIDFHANQLTEISRNTLSELRNLKDLEIHLQENKIKNIDDGSFSNLHCLLVDLSSNEINDESIENGAFRKLQVQKLSLGSNSITELDSQVFKGIFGSYELNLHGNKIAYIKKGDAEYLGNVKRLVLDRNPIERLDYGALYGLSQDEDIEISVHYTPLKVIQGGLFENKTVIKIK